MSKRIEVLIKESKKELVSLRNRQKSLGKQKRVIALERILGCKDSTRGELANFLGVNRKTLRRWLLQYNEGGIASLLEVRPKRKGSKIITNQIHCGLERRVKDPNNSFLGYWDAQRWIESEYGVIVNYHRVREYLKKHFETKVKKPRKSHVKKDDRAVALFKNATRPTQTYC